MIAYFNFSKSSCSLPMKHFFQVLLAAFVVTAAAPDQAGARCPFLECESGEASAPPRLTPAPPPPPNIPSRPTTSRPASAAETCSRNGSYLYCVSSVLAPQYGFTYGPEKLFDGKLDTAWVEGDPGDGIGEWIVIDLGGSRSISALQILNGYHKNAGIYERNNRVKEIEIRTSSGGRQIERLDDSAELQTVSIDGTSVLEWVQVIIRSVYRGSKYRDTAITELRVVQRGSQPGF
jgi:hypothetical protein